jgi:CIC family chloride channel protein
MIRNLQLKIQKFPKSMTVITSVLAVLVGLVTGAGIWLFKYLISLVKDLSFTRLGSVLSPLGGWTVALLPVIGGVLVGLLLHYWGGHEKIDGTGRVIQSIRVDGGRLRYKYLPVKTAAAILSIGTGASVGPEDPSVSIGANLGSMLGQWTHLSEERVSILVSAGVAAAIAAAFNAPIAGVFFALEIVLGDITTSSLGMILIASVTSSVFTQWVSGTAPAFQAHYYTFNSGYELVLYAGLGLLAGPISALYVRLLYWTQDLFQKIKLPRWAKTGLAGLAVGLVGIFYPQVFGVGYDTITSILSAAKLTLGVLLILMAAKLVLTPISIAGGFAGGVFAPSLFIGATLGGAFGMVMQTLFPALGISAPAYALVGMAAVLAGAVHAPLTAALLLFEMTSDYRIILPLMISVAVSLLISQKMQGQSMYEIGLARKGFFVKHGKDVDLLASLKVREVMSTNMVVLSDSMNLEDARRVMDEKRFNGAFVENDRNQLVGIITLQDMDRYEIHEGESGTLGEACNRQVEVTYPDETLASALAVMSRLDIGRIPVVLKEAPSHLVGVLRRSDIISAYNLAVERRVQQRHSEQTDRLDAITSDSLEVVDIQIQPQAQIVGKMIKEIAFPRDCIIVSVRRGHKTIVPHGETLLGANDKLVVVAEDDALREMKVLAGIKE